MSCVELCEEKSLLHSDDVEVREEAEEAVAPQGDRQGHLVLRLPSYRPTPWRVMNSLLDTVDGATRGRAGWVQRFVLYLFIGGSAAVVNLVVFYLVFYRIPLPVHTAVHNVIAEGLAAEISIMANFIPNDFFTFKYLPGHARSWGARCLRFHITSIGGSILTLLIEFTLHYLAHVPALVAQAVALMLVLVYNFSFHHIFTYRKTTPKTV
jgi:putative flippase GtrA